MVITTRKSGRKRRNTEEKSFRKRCENIIKPPEMSGLQRTLIDLKEYTI